jgi:hypothetical protein
MNHETSIMGKKDVYYVRPFCEVAMYEINLPNIYYFFLSILSLIFFSLFIEYFISPRDRTLPFISQFLNSHTIAWGVILASFSIPLCIAIKSPGIISCSSISIDTKNIIYLVEVILLIIIIAKTSKLKEEELKIKSQCLSYCHHRTREIIKGHTNALSECSLCKECNFGGIHIPLSCISSRLNPLDPANVAFKRGIQSLQWKKFIIGVLGSSMLIIAFCGMVIEFRSY